MDCSLCFAAAFVFTSSPKWDFSMNLFRFCFDFRHGCLFLRARLILRIDERGGTGRVGTYRPFFIQRHFHGQPSQPNRTLTLPCANSLVQQILDVAERKRETD